MRDDYLSYLARNEDRDREAATEPQLPSSDDQPQVSAQFLSERDADRLEMRAISGSDADDPQLRVLTTIVTLLESLPERLVSALREE